MTEIEFHKARRMFAVVHGTVLVARQGNPYSHVEWLGEIMGYDRAKACIANCTRGYVLGSRMVFYRGDDFSHFVDPVDILAAFHVLDNPVVKITEIGRGVIAGSESPWPPKYTDDAVDFIAKVTAHVLKRVADSDLKGKPDVGQSGPEASGESQA